MYHLCSLNKFSKESRANWDAEESNLLVQLVKYPFIYSEKAQENFSGAKSLMICLLGRTAKFINLVKNVGNNGSTT